MRKLLEDREEVGLALGRIPSGCSILTVTHAGRSTALLVSWIQQASFDPPCITVCVKRGRPAAPLIDASGKFVLNVIGEDPTPMFRRFAKGFTLDEDAFAGLHTEPTPFGPLIDECIAHLGCRVLQKVPVGDHDIYAAEVLAAHVLDRQSPYVHLRTTGLSY